MQERQPQRSVTDVRLDPRVADLVERIGQAKRMAGAMYAALRDRAPSAPAALALARLAADEESHATQLDALRVERHPSEAVRAAGLIGCSPYGETWLSGLMAAFALDQAATAALVALATSPDQRAAALAHRIVDEEESHQTFALEAFRALVREEPGHGLPLAREMIVDRDWVKQVFPRRAQLVSLADAGLLAADAPRAHDSFLASLGDHIQDALGVLGDL
jgi:hypothetical protein